MTIAAEIQSLSKANKELLQKFFFVNHARVPKSLKSFKKHERNALCFLSIETAQELCRFLDTPFFVLEEIMSHPVYEDYTILKKRGGKRHISAPQQALKRIQKRLNYFLQAFYLWIKPDQVHGFVIQPRYLVRHCALVQNAQVHVGKKYVLNIDLKDFFPGISAHRIKTLFSSDCFQFSEQLATALTLLTTYEGRLPTGAPTSPVLSNFICRQLDADLTHFCQQLEISYTRYADDLTFSSDSIFSDEIIQQIRSLIEKHHFEINEKKVRLKTANRKQTVTGLTVNQKVNVDRMFLKKIRAMLHDLTTSGLEQATKRHLKSEVVTVHQAAQFMHRLRGYINFVGQVRGKNDALYHTFKTTINKVLSVSK
jgi:RNA-directed DNA polymerase